MVSVPLSTTWLPNWLTMQSPVTCQVSGSAAPEPLHVTMTSCVVRENAVPGAGAVMVNGAGNVTSELGALTSSSRRKEILKPVLAASSGGMAWYQTTPSASWRTIG